MYRGGMARTPPPSSPRPCTIAAALEVVGDRWSLLIVRELFFDQQKFNDIVRNTGGPRDIIAVRLRKLLENGILDREPYGNHPSRYNYRLTSAGYALLPVLLTLKQWGRDHAWGGAPDPAPLVHRRCGHEFRAQLHCRDCGERLGAGELHVCNPWPDVASGGRDTAP